MNAHEEWIVALVTHPDSFKMLAGLVLLALLFMGMAIVFGKDQK